MTLSLVPMLVVATMSIPPSVDGDDAVAGTAEVLRGQVHAARARVARARASLQVQRSETRFLRKSLLAAQKKFGRAGTGRGLLDAFAKRFRARWKGSRGIIYRVMDRFHRAEDRYLEVLDQLRVGRPRGMKSIGRDPTLDKCRFPHRRGEQ